MKEKSKNWSIQISNDLRDILWKFCNDHGYKISGFVKTAIVNGISGSMEFKNNQTN